MGGNLSKLAVKTIRSSVEDNKACVKPEAIGTPPPSGRSVTAFERWLIQQLAAAAGWPQVTIALYGQPIYTPAASLGGIDIRDRAGLRQMCTYPDLYFGELYSAGRLTVAGDLIDVLTELSRALPDLAGRSLPYRLLTQLSSFGRNTLERARHNIYHHYDISNAFYRLWLDERMVYTCAYYPYPGATLETAQTAKLDHVCRKLRLQPGEEVIEAGCGWGALALHMARHYGVRVRAYNISREQLAYARDRARAEGLAGRVEFIESDYREIAGQCDAFVSVGMLEHVGLAHYRELGAVIDRCLRPHGRGLIHSIGRNRPAPVNAWITRRIFPGGYTPSLFEMADIFQPFRLSVLDVENLRLHYAQTLRHWLERFEAQADAVQTTFDETFVRAWRLYLAGSAAAFLAGELQLFQVVFARYLNNDVPMTRDFLYRS